MLYLNRSLCFASILSCYWLILPKITLAQIVPDTTLPSNSVSIPNGSSTRIEGGTTAGSNLFHSFQEFSLPTGQEAFFNNALDIQNIFSRVTGKAISNIDGVIKANGTANLFLINPNGIIFGPNAQLNIGGSFLGSTAHSIRFAEGTEFSTTNPTTPSLLSINVPIGLQLEPNSSQISVSGNGHDFTANGPQPFWFPLRRGNSNAGLRVQPGKTLALVGGDINLSGGIVAAPSGRIELSSIQAGSVSINPTVFGWSLGYSDVRNYGDIQLTSRALVDVSGVGSGTISIQTGVLRIQNTSFILSQNFAPLPPGSIEVHASRLVEMSSSNGDTTLITSIVSEALNGPGANINISSPQLRLTDGSGINAFSYQAFKGGNITINTTESTEIIGASPVNPAAVSSIQNFTLGPGQGGDTLLLTERLRVSGGGAIGSTTAGTGNGGSVTILTTDAIEVIGIQPITLIPSNVNAATIGMGNAGNLTLEGASLTVRDGGRVEGSTFASGEAASVTINTTDFVEISGKPAESINPSLVASSATIQDEALRRLLGLPDVPSGNAGNVTLNTPVLQVFDGGLASVRNEGVGNAGTLTVNSNLVILNRSGGLTAATSSGGGGNINIQAGNIILRNGSTISTNAGSSNGGNISLNTQTLAALDNADITANAREGFGGRVSIAAQGIFGTQFRESLTPQSDITATSERGVEFSGTVSINTPDVNPSSALVALPANLTQVSDRITTGCAADRQNSFFLTGRGGLPPSPTQTIAPSIIWKDLRLIGTSNTGQEQQQRRNPISLSQTPTSPMVEATGWSRDSQGRVVLLANSPYGGTQSSWAKPLPCNPLDSVNSLAPSTH